MTEDRWKKLMDSENQPMAESWLTPKELSEGWHWCPEWDGLLIGPMMEEWDACTCEPHPLFLRRLRRMKLVHNIKTVLVVWAAILGPYLLANVVLGLAWWVAAVVVLAFWAIVAASAILASARLAVEAQNRLDKEHHE